MANTIISISMRNAGSVVGITKSKGQTNQSLRRLLGHYRTEMIRYRQNTGALHQKVLKLKEQVRKLKEENERLRNEIESWKAFYRRDCDGA